MVVAATSKPSTQRGGQNRSPALGVNNSPVFGVKTSTALGMRPNSSQIPSSAGKALPTKQKPFKPPLLKKTGGTQVSFVFDYQRLWHSFLCWNYKVSSSRPKAAPPVKAPLPPPPPPPVAATNKVDEDDDDLGGEGDISFGEIIPWDFTSDDLVGMP
jgi:hypothetical protein